MTIKQLKQLVEALDELGVSESSTVEFGSSLISWVYVHVDNEYFGIYDLRSNTFVD